MRTPLRLTLYGRPWCHLCDEMAEALAPIAARHGAEVVAVDVETDPALEARYGLRIPVLVHDDHELCQYRLDASAVERYLQNRRRGID